MVSRNAVSPKATMSILAVILYVDRYFLNFARELFSRPNEIQKRHETTHIGDVLVSLAVRVIP